ncbi:hypothetical protein AVEN_76272-1 [Araneus ventricosus]|uniref:Uncharacterized protein n=1 Tax=Araneus ventricosus TaxID=182803 RepID=A0A4Y2I9X7_ARAVE|nr:hypothetical protein AVEN_76272-1 [Araneus ventricosus]
MRGTGDLWLISPLAGGCSFDSRLVLQTSTESNKNPLFSLKLPKSGICAENPQEKQRSLVTRILNISPEIFLGNIAKRVTFNAPHYKFALIKAKPAPQQGLLLEKGCEGQAAYG